MCVADEGARCVSYMGSLLHTTTSKQVAGDSEAQRNFRIDALGPASPSCSWGAGCA